MNTHTKTDFLVTIPTTEIKVPSPRRWKTPRTIPGCIKLAARLSTTFKRTYFVYGTANGPTIQPDITGIMQQYYRIDANAVTFYDRYFQETESHA